MRSILLVVTVGCGAVKANNADAPTGKDSAVDSPMTDAPIDSGNQTQHFYVADDATPGHVFRYTLPLTSTSTPDLTIPSTGSLVGAAFDPAGNLVVESNAGKLFVFVPPFSATSTPIATFQNGSGTSGGQVLVTQTGTLIAALQSTSINEFSPPFTNNSTTSGSITSTTGLNTNFGLALDGQANLYASNSVSGGGNLVMFQPPYTNGSAVVTPSVTGAAYRSVAVSGQLLFVGSVATASRVDVYNLPLTNTSAPAFSITTGTNAPEGVAVDALGHLYVGNLSDKTVSRYSAPFSAQSTPDVTITTTATIFGLAVGP
jgi:hypothetical protein